jgi:hypothetical protein
MTKAANKSQRNPIKKQSASMQMHPQELSQKPVMLQTEHKSDL